MSHLLALETSSPILSIAVKKKRGPVLESRIKGHLLHAENLFPVIDRLLKKARLSIQEIDTFLIGRGPGSFTGLRIGFAALKGFLAVSNKRKDCFGALSLDMIAENAAPTLTLPLHPAGGGKGRGKIEGITFAVCLDARREKIYARFYHILKDHAVASGKPKAMSFDQTLSRLPSEVYLTGDALIRYQSRFEREAGKKKIHFLPESLWYPKASTLIGWYAPTPTLPLHPTGGGKGRGPLHRLQKPADFLPLYFRLSEPEEKRKSHAHAS